MDAKLPKMNNEQLTMDARLPKQTVFTAVTAVAAVMLVFLIAILFSPRDCVVARDISGGKVLFAWPISIGDSFEVTFIHSLNLSPVTDVIEWDGGSMVVRKSIFQTFGAGIPVPSDRIGTELVRVGSHYELIGIDAHMQSFTVMTQDAPNHRITLNGREANLLGLAGSGKSVEVAVKRVPFVARAAVAMGLLKQQ